MDPFSWDCTGVFHGIIIIMILIDHILSWAKFSWIFMQLAIQFHEISYHDYFHGVIIMGISWEICLLVNLVIMLL